MSLRRVAVPLLILAACGGPVVPAPIARPPQDGDLPTEQAFLAAIDRSRGTRDCFTVISEPRFVDAAGPHGIAADEIVMGVDLGATQIAYPIQLLNFHEIVEHTTDDLALLACW